MLLVGVDGFHVLILKEKKKENLVRGFFLVTDLLESVTNEYADESKDYGCQNGFPALGLVVKERVHA